MNKGDIILKPFSFTDLSGNKNKPVLVLVDGLIDVTRAFVSTQLKWKEDTDVLITPTRGNGLKKDSLIRLSKLATIDKDLIIGRLGTIEDEIINKINKNLVKIFRLEE